MEGGGGTIALLRDAGGGGFCTITSWEIDPPSNEQIDLTENITFQQTTYADSNKLSGKPQW